MHSIHDFVTSFFSKDATTPQEPVANSSKVDTQDNVRHVANTQELGTDLRGVTQEPPVGKQKENDLDVAITQKPATDPTGDTQKPPVEDANDEVSTEK